MQSETVMLLVGTHKGGLAFVRQSDSSPWEHRGPWFRGMDVHHLLLDGRREPTLYACVNNPWWGSGVRFSTDQGATWGEPDTDVRFPDGDELKVQKVWCVVPGRESEPGVLYAGADPAALFRSADAGRNWEPVHGLLEQPTRSAWAPGMGGMMVHSICLEQEDPQRMHVGISAAGVFSTADGGTTWEARNQGVRADFMPEPYPEVGQCVHHLTSHPHRPHVLYQQNHCGVYRSEDEGRTWTDISEGLPSRFGFPMQVHPHEPDTVYVIPEESPECRYPVDGAFAVYRSRDRGNHWEALRNGLPKERTYLGVYRHAMCADAGNPCAIYVGTSTGTIFWSRDAGDSWEVLADWLPPIYSLSAAVV